MLNQGITPATCSRCGHQFGATAERILDLEKDPTAKTRLLSGRVNIARCPACGAEGALNLPFVYHDRSKELLLAYMPPSFGANETERQKVLGELTNAVMNSLPPEQRKAYLLQPKMFFTMQSMAETILQADGVTKEMMDAQRAHVDLINQMLQARDPSAFQEILDQNRDKIDYDFFQTLAASAEAAQANGQERVAQVLNSLSIRLMQEFGLPVGEEIAGEGSKGLLSREGLVALLDDAQDDEEFRTLVSYGRPLMDYSFFQEITAQMEAAKAHGDEAKAKRLSEMRARIVQVAEEMDAASKQVINQATSLLSGALQAEDPEAYLREHLNEMSEAFFVVLSANLNAAERDGHPEWVAKMEQIGDIAIRLIQEAAPPEVQLLNRLLAAPYPDGTLQILRENAAMVTTELVHAMRLIAEDLTRQGNLPVADKTKKVMAQAEALLADTKA
ncbi:MAG: CpXC domain-containing protein [Anaerolineae bacterium]|nr:CpXC domain-containing protein [Anaerolineae bacterium]